MEKIQKTGRWVPHDGFILRIPRAKNHGTQAYHPHRPQDRTALAERRCSVFGGTRRVWSTSADIAKIRQEARDKAKEMKMSVQPYIIIVRSIINVSDSYVTFDEVLYSTESTLEALDICLLKVFHVLKINYPDASKHLWMLIQKGLYEFCNEWDILFSNTEHVLKKLILNKCKPKTASV
ncbi:hypothetical protein ALC56_05607 [Trachymyrmex septentrionalis]|uniref:Uncharacterized protein n=1 Tax=Trachymyrmex septentrionalis TaxID=34720 RepID=A0A151JY26_9HYME|nr:hypothetical protein ALC56_05607 [Trachymyrmex septentrionalis]